MAVQSLTSTDEEADLRLSRLSSLELDNILGLKFKVLDDGFVYVVDYMGTDESITRAARVSYGKGTRSISDDEKLIRYLVRNNHSSPIEMAEITLHIRMPLYVFGQLVRHRTASLNCRSYRYSEIDDKVQLTKTDKWRLQSKTNKQGSDSSYVKNDLGIFLTDQELEFSSLAKEVYNKRIFFGVSREQARKDMPQSLYTEFYWKIDLRNLLHFLKLRTDKHAQEEIREYANIILENIVKIWVPLTYKAFIDYQRDNMNLSAIEIEIIKLLSQGKYYEASSRLMELNILEYDENKALKPNRERTELEDKLKILDIKFMWSNK